jgi:hypothetical protein
MRMRGKRKKRMRRKRKRKWRRRFNVGRGVVLRSPPAWLF